MRRKLINRKRNYRLGRKRKERIGAKLKGAFKKGLNQSNQFPFSSVENYSCSTFLEVSTIMNKEFLFWRGCGKKMAILLRDLEMGMGVEELLRRTIRSVFSGWDIPGLLYSCQKRKAIH